MALKSVYIGPHPSGQPIPAIKSTTVATRVYRHPYTYTHTHAHALTHAQPDDKPDLSTRSNLVTMKYRKSKLTAAQKKLLVRIPSSPVPQAKAIGSVEAPCQKQAHCDPLGCMPSYRAFGECLACRFSEWALAQSDKSPDALREAFIESLGGAESLRQDFAEAVRAMGGDFRSSVLNVSASIIPLAS